jgi:hypothetical protein
MRGVFLRLASCPVWRGALKNAFANASLKYCVVLECCCLRINGVMSIVIQMKIQIEYAEIKLNHALVIAQRLIEAMMDAALSRRFLDGDVFVRVGFELKFAIQNLF